MRDNLHTINTPAEDYYTSVVPTVSTEDTPLPRMPPQHLLTALCECAGPSNSASALPLFHLVTS